MQQQAAVAEPDHRHPHRQLHRSERNCSVGDPNRVSDEFHALRAAGSVPGRMRLTQVMACPPTEHALLHPLHPQGAFMGCKSLLLTTALAISFLAGCATMSVGSDYDRAASFAPLRT